MRPSVDTIVENLRKSANKSEKFACEINSVEETVRSVVEISGWIHLFTVTHENANFSTVCFLRDEASRSKVTSFHRTVQRSRETWAAKSLERIEKLKKNGKRFNPSSKTNHKLPETNFDPIADRNPLNLRPTGAVAGWGFRSEK